MKSPAGRPHVLGGVEEQQALLGGRTRGGNSPSVIRTTLPCKPPAKGKIAVKVINHYGDEVLKVFSVGNAGR